MLKKISLKIIVFFIIITICFEFSPNICFAEVNEIYGTPTGGANVNKIPSSILLEWIAKLAYNFGNVVESIGSTMMGWFTGVSQFPYSDKIVFNTIPILDINFINPSNGSLFKDLNGNITKVGEAVRNTYFTCLSIALGLLGIIIAVTAIRLAFSTIASEKAKYKQVIANTVITLILLFALHYIISFMFFLNETMVEVASTTLVDLFTGDKSEEVIKSLDESIMRNDKKLIENFFEKMGPNWLSPLTWVRETLHELANIGKEIAEALSKAVDWLKDKWNSFWGGEDAEDAEEDVTLDPSDEEQLASIEKVYPHRKDFQDDILNDETAMHIAAYLLRDDTYRDVYLKWAEGSDMDSFDKNGVEGVAISIASMINDCLNIVDSGYLGIRSLHASTFYIKNGKYESLINANAVTDSENELPNKITSTKAYNAYIVECDKKIAELEAQRYGLFDVAEKNKKNQAIKIYRSLKVYAKAYYKFIYDGDDKQTKGASELISEMGAYFKTNSKYVDIENGDWAPTSTSIPFGLLYAIFIIQSLIFLISYIKRLFYVVILSVLGPIVIIFDYMVKAI